MKIAFIGCGGIAGAHMIRLAQIPDVEFAAMCDIVEEKAKEASEKYGGKVYTDYHKMLDEVKVDACFICIPPFAHTDQELLCVDKRVPFFVEKPIHLDMEKAKEIALKVKEKNLITSTGYVLRYFDIVDKAKGIIAGEKIAVSRGKYFGQVPAAGKGWYSKKNKSGGQLIEQATHTVDMMRYLMGDIEEVFAYKFEGINNKIYEGYDVEDASTILLKFQNGIIGNLSCTWLWTGYNSGVEMIGQGIMLNYEGNSLTVDRVDKKTTYVSSVDPMKVEDESFISAVKNNDPSKVKSDYEDALKTLAVSICAITSFEKGIPIKIKD